ncbi:MAG: hypothetical protein HBSAPP03_11400 [Phycisphaerae bacterium]|nr:MAG: hypothetical protein HBSAPP03_11400 [Phycisphaerae bacterium]
MRSPARRWCDVSPAAFEPLEPRLALAADFVVTLGSVVNGFERKADAEMIRVTATIQNLGDVAARGGASLEFYLSTNPEFDDNDALFEVRRLGRLPMPGQTTVVTLGVTEPTLVDPPAPYRAVDPGDYYVIARLVLDQPSQEPNRANNIADGDGTVNIAYEFGFLNGKNRPFSWTQPDGSKVTLKFDGQGQGNLNRTDNGINMVVTSARVNTSLLISTTRRAPVRFSQIILPAGLDNLRAPNVTLTGLVSIQSIATNITLGGITRGSISITGFARHITLSLGEVTDTVVTSTVPISSLGVKFWRNTDSAPDFVRAPYIERLTSGGDFAPSITASSSNSKGYGLEKVKIKGEVSGVWSVAGSSSLIDVGSTAASFRAGFLGIIDIFRTKNDMRGLLAGSLIEKIDIGRDLISAQILSGYSLGADLQIGGTGANADQFRNGIIDRLIIGGRMTNSIVAAGLVTSDAVLLNGDDGFVANPPGARIFRIDIRKGMQNSFVLAPTLPATARVGFGTIDITDDPRFITELPLP